MGAAFSHKGLVGIDVFYHDCAIARLKSEGKLVGIIMRAYTPVAMAAVLSHLMQAAP